MFLEISQNSQENTVLETLLIKLQALPSACSFIKKDSLAQVFLRTIFYRTPLVATSLARAESILSDFYLGLLDLNSLLELSQEYTSAFSGSNYLQGLWWRHQVTEQAITCSKLEIKTLN